MALTKPKIVWPFTTDFIAATAIRIAIPDDTNPANATVVTVPLNASYAILGDNTASDLLKAVKDALNAGAVVLGQPQNFTVTVNASGQIILDYSADWSVYWAHASTTFPEATLGFLDQPYTGGKTHTSPNGHQRGWYPGEWLVNAGRSYPQKLSALTRATSGTVRVHLFSDLMLLDMVIEFVPAAKVFTAAAPSTLTAFEDLFDFLAQDPRCYSFLDATVSTNVSQVMANGEWINDWSKAVEEMFPVFERYRIRVPLQAAA